MRTTTAWQKLRRRISPINSRNSDTASVIWLKLSGSRRSVMAKQAIGILFPNFRQA